MDALDTVLDILEDLNPGVDYENCTTLVDDRFLDSLTIVALVAELEDTFDVSIPAVEVIPENFNSAAGLAAMMQRLCDEELA